MATFNSSSSLIVVDRPELDRLRLELADALDDEGDIDPSWLRERGWIAVPFEAPIDDEEAERLARAMVRSGVAQGHAVALEEGLEDFGFRFPVDADAILEADAECSMKETSWAPDNGGFLLRGDGDLYFIVAGPEAFLREVIGGPIEEARAAFDSYAHDPDLASDVRDHLQEIARSLAGPAAG